MHENVRGATPGVPVCAAGLRCPGGADRALQQQREWQKTAYGRAKKEKKIRNTKANVYRITVFNRIK